MASRAALKSAGIDRSTPTPAGGVIERDAGGEPTRIVKDNATRALDSKLPADPSDLAFPHREDNCAYPGLRKKGLPASSESGRSLVISYMQKLRPRPLGNFPQFP